MRRKAGLLGNFLPPKRDGRTTACCAECKAIKYISRMFLEDGSKAKISGAGPFFCSYRCAYAHRQKKETPDWVRK